MTVAPAALGAFARACLGVALDDADRAALVPDKLVGLAERHRVSAVAYERLAALASGDVADTLRGAATQRRFDALRNSRETVRLSLALDAAGVRHLVVKGAPLAFQLYGDVAARDSKDIDLLVDAAQWDVARGVVEAAGYAPHREQATAPGTLATKDSSFIDRATGVEVELHHRLFDIAALLPRRFDELWADRATVAMGGAAIPVLSRRDTFLYLCGHGAESAWFRLKWLQDIARIRADTPAAELSGHVAAARAIGFGRVVASALVLADQIYGSPDDASDIVADRGTRRIVAWARGALEAPEEAAYDRSLGQLLRDAIDRARFRRDWRYRSAIVRGIFLTPNDVAALDLPRWAWWLHVPLRPVMLLKRRMGRKRGR